MATTNEEYKELRDRVNKTCKARGQHSLKLDMKERKDKADFDIEIERIMKEYGEL